MSENEDTRSWVSREAVERKEGWNRVNESPDVEGVPEEGNIGKGRREGGRERE